MIDNRMQAALKRVVIWENLVLEFSDQRTSFVHKRRELRLLVEYSNWSRKHLWPGNKIEWPCNAHHTSEETSTKQVRIESERMKQNETWKSSLRIPSLSLSLFRSLPLFSSRMPRRRDLYGRPRGSRVGEFIYTALANVGACTTISSTLTYDCIGKRLAVPVETIHLTCIGFSSSRVDNSWLSILTERNLGKTTRILL